MLRTLRQDVTRDAEAARDGAGRDDPVTRQGESGRAVRTRGEVVAEHPVRRERAVDQAARGIAHKRPGGRVPRGVGVGVSRYRQRPATPAEGDEPPAAPPEPAVPSAVRA